MPQEKNTSFISPQGLERNRNIYRRRRQTRPAVYTENSGKIRAEIVNENK